MYVCIYVFMFICIYVYVYICKSVYISIYVCIYNYIYINYKCNMFKECLNLCNDISICKHMHTYIHSASGMCNTHI